MKNTIIKIFTGILYATMIAVNFMANSLPINNRSTGAISDAYPNLFTPTGLTFSIWGLIYFLLGGYVLYQYISFGKKSNQKKKSLLQKVNLLFIATSIANILWIFAWHYDFIGLSVIIITTLLFFLIKITNTIHSEQFSKMEKLWISLPFSVYFGWVTVATIANITVFLVSIGWRGFGIPDYIWTSVILLVGALIGIVRMQKDKNIAYGIVLIWAYLGILLKHVSASGFDGQYPNIIITVIACLVLFGFFTIRLLYQNNQK